MIDEQKLVAAAQGGDLPAFNQLVLHYQGLAYNVAYRVMGTQDGAADATQDAFFEGVQGIAQLSRGSFQVMAAAHRHQHLLRSPAGVETPAHDRSGGSAGGSRS